MTEDHPDLAERERRDRALQEIIDVLVRDRRRRTVDEAADDLERHIAESGLPAMPVPWVRAVAEGVANGEAYVVSADTYRHMAIPAPTTRVESYGID